MFGYIYESIDKRNKMIYIGKREQRVFDPDYHGSGKIVLNILKKYGNDIFITRQIDQIDEEDEKRLKEREKDYIKAYRIFYGEDKLYNIADGGDGGATTRGRKFTFTKEHCANIGKTRLGKSSWSKGLTKETDERVANLSKILTGKHRVEGFGERVRQFKLGKKQIYNPKLNQGKQVKPEEVQEYINAGWLLGSLKGKNGKKEHKVGCNCGGCKKRRGERIVHKPNCKCIACVNHRNKLAGVPRLYSNSHNSGKTRVYNLELNQGKLIDSEQVQEYLKNEWLLGSLKGKVI